jgi:hypothetical protein
MRIFIRTPAAELGRQASQSRCYVRTGSHISYGDRGAPCRHDLVRGISRIEIVPAKSRGSMREVWGASVCSGRRGGSISPAGSPRLRAMRREGTSKSHEKPDRRGQYHRIDGPGTRDRGHLGSVRAWFAPLDPGDCYSLGIPCDLWWRGGLDETGESPRGAASRSTGATIVERAKRFNARADGRRNFDNSW